MLVLLYSKYLKKIKDIKEELNNKIDINPKIPEQTKETKNDYSNFNMNSLLDEINNEINCIHRVNVGSDKIILLHDFTQDYSYDVEKNKLYNEAK